jgi:large conductance mechanosensitive channel
MAAIVRYTSPFARTLKGKHVKGFRDFIFRGNLLELAVAFVVGAAFTALVTALVADLITPLLAAIGGKPDFSSLYFTVHNSKFMYGSFVNAVITFIIIAAAMYFVIVMPVGKALTRMTRKKEATERECPECLSEIPVAARRCMYCTSEVPAV